MATESCQKLYRVSDRAYNSDHDKAKVAGEFGKVGDGGGDGRSNGRGDGKEDRGGDGGCEGNCDRGCNKDRCGVCSGDLVVGVSYVRTMPPREVLKLVVKVELKRLQRRQKAAMTKLDENNDGVG